MDTIREIIKTRAEKRNNSTSKKKDRVADWLQTTLKQFPSELDQTNCTAAITWNPPIETKKMRLLFQCKLGQIIDWAVFKEKFDDEIKIKTPSTKIKLNFTFQGDHGIMRNTQPSPQQSFWKSFIFVSIVNKRRVIFIQKNSYLLSLTFPEKIERNWGPPGKNSLKELISLIGYKFDESSNKNIVGNPYVLLRAESGIGVYSRHYHIEMKLYQTTLGKQEPISFQFGKFKQTINPKSIRTALQPIHSLKENKNESNSERKQHKLEIANKQLIAKTKSQTKTIGHLKNEITELKNKLKTKEHEIDLYEGKMQFPFDLNYFQQHFHHDDKQDGTYQNHRGGYHCGYCQTYRENPMENKNIPTNFLFSLF